MVSPTQMDAFTGLSEVTSLMLSSPLGHKKFDDCTVPESLLTNVKIKEGDDTHY